MANITTTTAAQMIPEVYSAHLQVAYDNNLVIEPLIDHQYQRYVKGVHKGGDIINVPKVANLSASTQSVDGDLTLSANTEGNTQITFATWQGVGYRIDDVADLQVMDAYMDALAQKAGEALAKAVDTAIAALFASITNNVGTLGQVPSDDNILSAEEYLNLNNVPMNQRYLVLGPRDLTGLRKEERYSNSLYNTGNLSQAQGNGHWGKLYTCDLYISNNLPTNGSGRDGAMIHKECLAMVYGRPVYSEDYRDGRQGSTERYSRVIYGVKEMRDADGGVWVKAA